MSKYFSLFFEQQQSKAKREGQKEEVDLEVASDPNNDKGKTHRVNYTLETFVIFCRHLCFKSSASELSEASAYVTGSLATVVA